MPQFVLYDAGVGTTGVPVARLRDGLLGQGLDDNLRQLYTALALNYVEGDQLFFFGFSRGAYTVRSLAGFIGKCGLVRRSRVGLVNEAFEIYRGRSADTNGGSRGGGSGGGYSRRSESGRGEADMFKHKNCRQVPIELIACWDTVGALGVPDDIFGMRFKWANGDRYNFHDITLGQEVQNAIHMVSIDEMRAGIFPTQFHPLLGQAMSTMPVVKHCGHDSLRDAITNACNAPSAPK